MLAVDTAETSGWSLVVCGAQHDFGEVHTWGRPEVLEQIVRWAVLVAAGRRVPVVLVLEAPWGGTVATIAGLGAARDRWIGAWRRSGQALGRVVKVMPSSWRAAVLGAHWARAKREAVRDYELVTARALLGNTVAAHSISPDEAAAVCIGRWASHAAAVGRVIGERARDASLKAWGVQP